MKCISNETMPANAGGIWSLWKKRLAVSSCAVSGGVVTVLLALALGGCSSQPALSARSKAAVAPSKAAAPASAGVYALRGEVVALSPAQRQVTVRHEDIPGLMPAMTMPFAVPSAAVLRGVRVGDRIQARLRMTRSDSWLEALRVSGKGGVARASVGAKAFRAPKPGQAVPSVRLTNQDGRSVLVGGAGAKPQVVTFVYTRCPLPNACPLMRQRLAQLQSELRRQGRLDEARLFCVTLDPEHDTPRLLRAYGQSVGADFGHWQFVTGAPQNVARLAASLGEVYAPNGDLVSHNLVTAVIGRDGRLRRAFIGNEWRQAELLAAAQQAIATPAIAARAGAKG